MFQLPTTILPFNSIAKEGEEDEDEEICSLCNCLEDMTFTRETPSGRYSGYNFRNCRMKKSRVQAAYFHKGCHQCPSISQDLLCVVCKHMRLRHLIQCILLADSLTEEVLNRPKRYPCSLDTISLELGCARDLEERSIYCDICRFFSGTAKEVMEQDKLSSDLMSHIRVTRSEFTNGGVKSSFRDKVFIGTIEPTHGHRLVSTPIPQQAVDWQKVSKWVRDCHSEKHTGSCQTKPDVSRISGLRVIDTRKRCITIAPGACQYAALSYVWGAVSSLLQATMANIDHLSEEGSLNSDRLPQTIDDAIVACRKLGIDYLWVDCLCILQDEHPNQKAYWLDSMGAIYAKSFVTIVALAGENADHGLPGVNKVSRVTCWGWTFQEAALSTRRLLFSDTRVFYECCHTEHVQADSYGKRYDVKIAAIPLFCYSRMVEDFTNRDLTCESDVLRAFAGVLHTNWGQECYYGLPLRIFRDAIIWTAVNKIHPRRHAAPGDVFPTWSWSSIKGPIEMRKATRTSLAIWAIPSRSSHQPDLQFITYSVWNAGKLEESKKLKFEKEVDEKVKVLYLNEKEQRLAAIMAWKCGCFSGSLPSILNTRATLKNYERILGKWRSHAQLCEEAHGMLGNNMREQDMNARFPSYMRQACSSGSILIYTQSLNLNQLRLGKKSQKYYEEEVFIIEAGDFVAEVITGSLNMERINLVQQKDPNSQFTLLALSVTHNDGDMSSMCMPAIPRGYVWWDCSARRKMLDNIDGPSSIDDIYRPLRIESRKSDISVIAFEVRP
ncbi:HET domain-containing protein [Aspergillus neoniger CBS 115656]|uniref:Heterokaryon incompatibility domain-containing protein n=1 Tax=Aspergillus neoniger (strain CBS 115656) TaxID=1448310 RepID=A0A318Y351_ASPNB|nr:hypothetical protein BO87DRAFT_371500 [Aspergillus neoniger CBS 115656]PYH28174.1 hypothetical protein BO87DRAFT_371500 [Aspergillus neoniger CBS 115656]